MSEALKEILKLITSVQFGGVSRLDLKPRDQVYKSIEELDDEGKLVAFVNDGDLKNLADFTLKTAQTSLEVYAILFTNEKVDVKAAGGACLNNTKQLVSNVLIILNNFEKKQNGDDNAAKLVEKASGKSAETHLKIVKFFKDVDERQLLQSNDKGALANGSVLLSPRQTGAGNSSKAAKAQRDKLQEIKRADEAKRQQRALLDSAAALTTDSDDVATAPRQHTSASEDQEALRLQKTFQRMSSPNKANRTEPKRHTATPAQAQPQATTKSTTPTTTRTAGVRASYSGKPSPRATGSTTPLAGQAHTVASAAARRSTTGAALLAVDAPAPRTARDAHQLPATRGDTARLDDSLSKFMSALSGQDVDAERKRKVAQAKREAKRRAEDERRAQEQREAQMLRQREEEYRKAQADAEALRKRSSANDQRRSVRLEQTLDDEKKQREAKRRAEEEARKREREEFQRKRQAAREAVEREKREKEEQRRRAELQAQQQAEEERRQKQAAEQRQRDEAERKARQRRERLAAQERQRQQQTAAAAQPTTPVRNQPTPNQKQQQQQQQQLQANQAVPKSNQKRAHTPPATSTDDNGDNDAVVVRQLRSTSAVMMLSADDDNDDNDDDHQINSAQPSQTTENNDNDESWDKIDSQIGTAFDDLAAIVDEDDQDKNNKPSDKPFQIQIVTPTKSPVNVLLSPRVKVEADLLRKEKEALEKERQELERIRLEREKAAAEAEARAVESLRKQREAIAAERQSLRQAREQLASPGSAGRFAHEIDALASDVPAPAASGDNNTFDDLDSLVSDLTNDTADAADELDALVGDLESFQSPHHTQSQSQPRTHVVAPSHRGPLSLFERDLFEELNALRRAPATFAGMIRGARIPFYAGRQLNLTIGAHQRVALGTYEGVQAASEAVNILQSHPALSQFILAPALCTAARHALDRNEERPDALSTLFEYGDASGRFQQISYIGSFPEAHASDVVMAMLISDGDSARHNRRAVLHERMQYIGVAANAHTGYNHRQTVCIVLCEQFVPS